MPQNTQDIIRTIESQNESVVSAMLFDLIDQHKQGDGRVSREAYGRYKQDHASVPIFNKPVANYEKVHEKLPNDFVGDIVDLKTGYMGNEIIIGVDERKVPEEAARTTADGFLREFATDNSLVDGNSELVKMAAITGKGYRLLFVSSEDGRVKVLNSDPWETVIYRDGSLMQPVAGMRYYTVDETSYDINRNKAEHEKRYRVEWYDQENITYYIETKDHFFKLDLDQPAEGPNAFTGKQPHLFDGVPLVEFLNNKEGQGEPHKVLDLIDAYDAIISASTSEVEQLRMAYMWARGAGMKLDADFEDQLKQTGLWPLPQDGEIGFASKDLGGAAGFVTATLDELRRNIYSFAKSLDLSHDRGGDMRVIGWQIAMLRLEMSAQVTERKFKKAYRRQYQLLTDFWRQNVGVTIDPLSLRFVFTRKFPKDIDQEIDTLIKAIEVMPLDDAYGLMTFIETPKEMADKYRKERPEMSGILNGLDEAGV